MASVLREFVIDCADPELVARWWGDVLGWPVVAAKDGYWWSAVTADPGAPAPVLVFVPVPEGKTVKNRIHLDLNPSGCEQAEELERLLALGARPVDVGQRDVPWVVLADPEGNELCLLSRRIDQPT